MPALSGVASLFADRLTAVRRLAAVLLVCLGPVGLGACSTLQQVEGPPPSSDMDKDIADLEAHYGASSIGAYYAAHDPNLHPGNPETADTRNEFITGRLTLINLRYLRYVEQFPLDTATFNTILDITKLGLDIAGTATGASGTKTVLAAIASGVTGSRLSIDKNFLDEKTAGALVSTMNAQRKAALIPILKGMQTKNLADYPLANAIVDLDNYYYVGTLPGALNTIQADAGVKDAQKQGEIDRLAPYRDEVYGADDNSAKLSKWLYPNASPGPKGKMVAADGSAAKLSQENLGALQEWFTNNGLVAALPFQAFVTDAKFASLRAKAVVDLKIQ